MSKESNSIQNISGASNDWLKSHTTQQKYNKFFSKFELSNSKNEQCQP